MSEDFGPTFIGLTGSEDGGKELVSDLLRRSGV